MVSGSPSLSPPFHPGRVVLSNPSASMFPGHRRSSSGVHLVSTTPSAPLVARPVRSSASAATSVSRGSGSRRVGQHPVSDSRRKPAPSSAPDGGWGWIVALASFTINFIVDGVCLSYGVFYVELRENFGYDSISKIAFIGSLTTGTYLGIGPFVGGFANKYGCRPVTIAGSIIASAAVALSALSPNVEMLLVTYGVMGGIGFGMMYLPSIVIVSYYFDRRRALATGIAVCGSGMGVLVFAPAARLLLDTYGWRGGNLILAGFILNGIACGLVFRPLPPTGDTESPASKGTSLSSRQGARVPSSAASTIDDEPCPRRGCIFEKIIQEKIRQREGSTGSLDGTVITTDNRLVRAADLTSVAGVNDVRVSTIGVSPLAVTSRVDMNPAEVATAATQQRVLDDRRRIPERRVVDRGPFQSDSDDNDDDNEYFTFTSDYDNSATSLTNDRTKNRGTSGDQNSSDLSSESVVTRVMVDDTSSEERDDRHQNDDEVFCSRSVVNGDARLLDVESAAAKTQQNSHQVVDWTELSQGQDRGRKVPSQESRSPSTSGSCLPSCSEVLEWSLLRSATFVVLCLTIVIPFFGIYTPFVYIGDHADQLGVSKEDAAWLLSILGISNTVGRLVAGWLADKSSVDSVAFHYCCLLIGGAATCVVSMLSSYELVCVYLVVYGACMAVFITLKSIIIVELLGLHKLTSAFGLTGLFQGLAAMAGTPLTGMLYDVTDSYTWSFIVAGLLLIVGGFVAIPIRRLRRAEYEREKRKDYLETHAELVTFRPNNFK